MVSCHSFSMLSLRMGWHIPKGAHDKGFNWKSRSQDQRVLPVWLVTLYSAGAERSSRLVFGFQAVSSAARSAADSFT